VILLRFVYADNAATTRIADPVLAAMMPYLTENYGNPSTLYKKGREAKKALDDAREKVAALIGATPYEIIFTGGGSEADNMAIKGVLTGKAAKGRKKLIISSIEHHAVLHTADALKKAGYDVVVLPVDSVGVVDLEALESAIDENTALVSIMAANNEIGTIEPIRDIARICHDKGVLFHSDAVQAAGHIPLDVKEMGIDLLSLSAHKINGPKGVGALYVKKGVALAPVIDGGGQERGLRSGTENVAGLVGLGEAARIAKDHMGSEGARLAALRDKLIAGVTERIPFTHVTGHPQNRLPGTASFVFECIEGESLILRLDAAGICGSTGSACSTGSLDPSHVLMAIGLKHEIAHGSLRLSLGIDTNDADIDYIVDSLVEIVGKLRDMSPLWDAKEKKPVK